MSERSAVIGLFPDGSMRLRVSLPGFDAYTGPDAGMSFDSAWADILKVHQIGPATIATFPSSLYTTVPFPDLGYTPFIEIRRRVGNIVYDDYVSDNRYGFGAAMYSDRFTVQGESSEMDVLYVVYKIPVPSP